MQLYFSICRPINSPSCTVHNEEERKLSTEWCSKATKFFSFMFQSLSFLPNMMQSGQKEEDQSDTKRNFLRFIFRASLFFFESEYQAEKRWCPAIWSITSGVFGVSRKATTFFVPLLQWKSQPCAERIIFFVQHDNRAKNCIEQRSLTHFFLFVSSPGLECDDDVSRNYLTRARQ